MAALHASQSTPSSASFPGLTSTSTEGTGAIRTELGTVVPTLTVILRFEARGALLELMTVSRILVFCSVLSVTLEPALPPVALNVDVEPLAPPASSLRPRYVVRPAVPTPFPAPDRRAG